MFAKLGRKVNHVDMKRVVVIKVWNMTSELLQKITPTLRLQPFFPHRD